MLTVFLSLSSIKGAYHKLRGHSYWLSSLLLALILFLLFLPDPTHSPLSGSVISPKSPGQLSPIGLPFRQCFFSPKRASSLHMVEHEILSY